MENQAVDFFSIRPAEKNEYDTVRLFYHAMIKAMEGAEYSPGWKIDVYPAPDYLRTVIDAGELYVAESGIRIASCMVVNQESNDAYSRIEWPSGAAPDECVVIHALGVHPDFAGKGLAKKMVRKAVNLAENAGRKAVRLDVLCGNVPAESLYEGIGFRKVQTIPMFYEDTGWTDYEGYELIL